MSCQMFSRRSTALCKQQPHGQYCIQHSRYSQYLDNYTVEQIRNFPKCTECEMQFLPAEPRWKVCKDCQDRQNRPYCAWYSRREPTDPIDIAPIRCPWRAPEGKLLCSRHSDIETEWLTKQVKYCSGCRKPHPLESFGNHKRCDNCSGRTVITNKLIQDEQKITDIASDHKCFTCDTIVSGSLAKKWCIRCMCNRKINDAENKRKFHLTDEEAIKLMLSMCTYCKDPDFYVNGIDRIDSAKEYVRGNVVSACNICNKMKNDRAVEKYLKMCEHISHYLKTGEQLYPELFDVKKTSPKYRIYAKSAKDRGYEFSLTLAEFESFLGKACTYCGNNVNIGIDRIDSAKSYTMDNCVPCCKECNVFKLNFSHAEFIDKIHKVAANANSIREFLAQVTRKTTIKIIPKSLELST